MELDKENQEQQMSVRKTGVIELDGSVARTPFAKVNRRSAYGEEPASLDTKSKHCLTTPAGKGCSLQRQAIGTCVSFSSPLRDPNKEAPLEGEATLSSSLPASILELPPLSVDTSPVISLSCPQVSSPHALPLPPICETPPFHSAVTPATLSSLELSLECEDGSQHSQDQVSYQMESDSEYEAENSVEGVLHQEDYLDNRDPTYQQEATPDCKAAGNFMSNVLLDEGISSGTESPEKNAPSGLDSKTDEQGLSPSGMAKEESKNVIIGIVRGILQDMLLEVVEETDNPQGVSQENIQGSDRQSDLSTQPHVEQAKSIPHSTGAQKSDQQWNSADQPHTFMSEYAKFVEAFAPEDSPAECPNATSSLTDVTPFSQSWELDPDQAGNCCPSDHSQPLVVLDSLSSFISDSDDSSCSFTTVQRQLTFPDGESTGSGELDESTMFVRSSESMCDLRENPLRHLDVQDGRTFPEIDSLNLSISDQKVEFFALPSSASLRRHAPNLGEARCRSVGSSPILFQILEQTHRSEEVNSSCASKQETHDTASVSAQSTEIQTLTVSAEAVTASFSPDRMLTYESTSFMQKSETLLGNKTAPVESTSVALSPMPRCVREMEVNTDATETTEADMMAVVVTSDVALSPVVYPVREVNTMTTNTETAEVGIATEVVECQDHSVLATTEVDSKTTMTDNTGRRSIFTTMTPFKAMAKQGGRLTSDDIRKQHPRTVANQLETLTVANTRLESELRSAQQERKRLMGALKEAKKTASSKDVEMTAADKQRLEELKERELQLEEKCHHLEQLSSEQQGRIASLEGELSSLRTSSEAAAQEETEALAMLQEKCKALEDHSQDKVQVQKCDQSESYRHQFELAQQMVREREAELSEIRGLFADLQATAEKQEKVSKAYREIHCKVLSLAEENHSLRETLAEKAACQEDKERSEMEVRQLQQDKASLEEEAQSLRQTMAINNSNLAELEKLYSASSTDLLAATGSMVKLNAELAGARKALQDALLSKNALARQSDELEERLSTTVEDSASISAALKQTQIQLQKQSSAYEKLRVMSQKMKTIYDNERENMALGVENLQRTLDNRELDIDNLEKDLYECRNIIVEQRYKIDGLQSELQEVKSRAASDQSDKEDIEFYKESNAFLEAERSLYVLSLRDLEDKLKAASLQSSQHQQAAEDAEKLVQELQEEKHRLKSQLLAARSQFLTSSQALTAVQEQYEQSETVAMAAANDLLQHMRLMLAGLKKKIGVQDVPELYFGAEHAQQQQQRPSFAQSRSVKSKRHSRKSFVSKILGAANNTTTGSDQDEGLMSATTEDEDDMKRVETGSYLDENFNHSTNRSLKEGNMSCSVMSPRDLGTSRPDSQSANSKSLTWAGFQASGNQADQNVPAQCLSPVSAGSQHSGECHFSPSFSLTHITSTSFPPPPSLLHPPSSQPASSAFARVRSIPKTKRRSEQPPSSHHRSPLHRVLESEDGGESRDGGFLDCMAALKEVFSTIVRLASILDRATQLSLQDLREENDMLRERTEIMEKRLERNSAQLSIGCQETVAKDETIAQLQQQLRERTEQMMNLTDHKFEVKRLVGEVKRLKGQLEGERSEKEVVSAELENLLQRLEHPANPSGDGGMAQARCMRDIISLKKKNQQLSNRLEEQRDHYEERGSKAARRIRVLDDNWKKAEDEVYKLDQLVENVKQLADDQSTSPNSSLHHILCLINGETKSSPV